MVGFVFIASVAAFILLRGVYRVIVENLPGN